MAECTFSSGLFVMLTVSDALYQGTCAHRASA